MPVLEGQRDVVEASEQAAAELGVDRERHAATGEADLLGLEVDLALAGRGERADVGLREHHGQQPDLHAVVVEDVAEARRDDGTEAVVLDGPRRVLARGAAAEVAPGGEDRVAWQFPTGLLGPVEEQELAETGPLDPFEE